MYNPLKDLHNYNSEMSISQVIKFFEKQGLTFTKTMIQNYVRIGAIPPPVDKRIYRKEHLMMLVLLDSLKNVFSLDEIKITFEPFFDTDKIKYVYDKYMEETIIAEEAWKLMQDETAKHPIDTVIKLMASSAVIKQFAQKIINS